jgi:hypothetical protein
LDEQLAGDLAPCQLRLLRAARVAVAARKFCNGRGAATAGANSRAGQPPALVHDVQLAYAHSTQTIFYLMAAVMAATFIVAIRGLPRGRARSDLGRLGPGARSRILSLTAPVARVGRFGETDPVRPIGDRLT